MLLLVLKLGGKSNFSNGQSLNSYLYFLAAICYFGATTIATCPKK
jgi:hypothetical protein